MGCAQSGSKTPKGRDRRYLGTGDKGNRKMNKKDMAKIELEFLTSDLVENNVYPEKFLQEHTVLPEELGRGAFSVVIAAIHKDSKEKRAVKVVENPKLSDVLDLQREVKILKQLEHKNILKVFSTYTKPGIFLMVSELCKGKELFRKIVDMYDVEQDDTKVYGFTERHASSIVRQIDRIGRNILQVTQSIW